jgi:hypothetical protein
MVNTSTRNCNANECVSRVDRRYYVRAKQLLNHEIPSSTGSCYTKGSWTHQIYLLHIDRGTFEKGCRETKGEMRDVLLRVKAMR